MFAAGLLAATLLPFGSEPVVVTYLLTQGPFTAMDRVWVVIAAGTGNTIGGAITYGMGRGAINIWQRYRSSQLGKHPEQPPKPQKPTEQQQKRSLKHARAWLDRWGPGALIMSWLPVVGDPLCLVAGGLRLSFGWCLFWMAIGKCARYAFLVWAVLAF
jgi:membrane protein YqaA with SNARE-associated domain